MKLGVLTTLTVLCVLPTGAWAQTPGISWSVPAANMIGRHSADVLSPGSPTTPVPNGRSDIYDKYQLWGTDLGFAAITGTGISLAFGDSWKNTAGTAIGAQATNTRDDVTGWISIASPGWSTSNPSGGFPDGNAVDRWIAAHGDQFWDTPGPPMVFFSDSSGQVPIEGNKLYAASSSGTSRVNVPGYTTIADPLQNRYPSGLGDTPSGAFGTPSNGQHRHWATFIRHEIHYATATTPCDAGFTLDPNMGTCGGTWSTAPLTTNGIPCVGIGPNARCINQQCLKPLARASTAQITGLCLDTTSSLYDGSPGNPSTASVDGRIFSVVLRQLVGYQDSSTQSFLTQPYNTNKFINPALATVQNFSPSRVSGSNDYNRATTSSSNNRVFIWGRPNFLGFGNQGYTAGASPRSAKLYFAYVDLPSTTSFTATAWTLHVFTGFGSSANCLSGPNGGNYPCFSTDQSKAKALDLGGGSDPSFENKDIIGQMSVAWIPQLGRFMMIYGGDLADGLLTLAGGPNWQRIQRNSSGYMYARFAQTPWGPWSAPDGLEGTGTVTRDAFNNVTSATGGIFQGTSYKSGQNSLGWTPNYSSTTTCDPDIQPCGTCNTAQVSCLDSEDFFQNPPYSAWGSKIGRLYGASIIPLWTKASGSNADVYWLASSWNPYQVVLMKTRVTPP